VQKELSSLVSSQCRLLAFELEQHHQQEKLVRQTRCPSPHLRAEPMSEQGSSVSLVCVPSVKMLACQVNKHDARESSLCMALRIFRLIGPSQMHNGQWELQYGKHLHFSRFAGLAQVFFYLGEFRIVICACGYPRTKRCR
jgi:hypothetical protein